MIVEVWAAEVAQHPLCPVLHEIAGGVFEFFMVSLG